MTEDNPPALKVLAFSICLLLFAAAPMWASSVEERALVAAAFAALQRGSAANAPERQLAAYREGVSQAEEAIRLDDADADAHYALFCNLGRVTELSGPLRQALNLPRLRRELDRAVELNPRHSEALAAKGEMLLRLPRLLGGDAEQAEGLARSALVYDPVYWRAHVLLARVLIAQARPDAARTELTEMLGHIGPERPERAEALRLLADLGDAPP